MVYIPLKIVVFSLFVSVGLTGCPVPTKHYTTLGCVPSKELAANECPRWFNCSALENRSSDKCYLYGQVYEPSEQAKCYVNECAFELISPSVLSNGAAPVYYGKRCCPWEWRLPKQEDRVNRTNGIILPMDPTEPMCKYGKLSLKVGEALHPEVTPMGVYECLCTIPPMVHCFLTTT